MYGERAFLFEAWKKFQVWGLDSGTRQVWRAAGTDLLGGALTWEGSLAWEAGVRECDNPLTQAARGLSGISDDARPGREA